MTNPLDCVPCPCCGCCACEPTPGETYTAVCQCGAEWDCDDDPSLRAILTTAGEREPYTGSGSGDHAPIATLRGLGLTDAEIRDVAADRLRVVTVLA